MDLTKLVQDQKHYFSTGATRNVDNRKRALRTLLDGLERHENALLAALEADLGKGHFEGYMTEVGMVRAEIRHALKHVAKWSRPRKVRGPITQFPSRGEILREPYGTALIIAPWNYPVQLNLVPLISALAAGCTAVVKPSAYAPATSHALAELLGDCFQPEYVAVVEGGRAENTALLEEPFDRIFFTGSPAVGRTVMAAAARHLTPVTLELGGKSPVILTEDADLSLAARRLVWGKFLNAGQTCVAPDHVWVPEKLRDPFVEAVQGEIARQYGPDPLHSPDLGCIINEKHFRRLLKLLPSGRTACGGTWEEETRKIAPTVLVDVTEEDPVMGEEIFGPILPVLTYDDLDELLAHLAQKPHPLALYVFTRSSERAQKVLNAFPFGGGCVNDAVVHLTCSGLPFGGVGESGMGRCHGQYGFETFTHEKGILWRGNLEMSLRYPPHKGKTMETLKKFM